MRSIMRSLQSALIAPIMLMASAVIAVGLLALPGLAHPLSQPPAASSGEFHVGMPLDDREDKGKADRATPRIQAPSPSAVPNPALPTVFVVGDSTARNNAGGAQGWGDPFASYFDSAKVNVLNRAMAGRSSRTFITEGRWDNVLKEMKVGDFVLIQLGHNDGGPIDTGRARASLPGLGEETREVTRADGSKEVVHTYGWYLRKMIADTKAKGAHPLLLSLTVRNIWNNGKVERGSGRYRELIAELAKSQDVPFVDVTDIIADQYQRLGKEKVSPLFGPDYVHTSPAGADFNAAAVVAGLKRLTNDPLVNFLSDKGKAVTPAGPVSSPTSAPE